jgi:hypothetical protein
MSTKCESCGKPWDQHMGIMGTCNELQLITEQRDAALWCLEVSTQERDTYKSALQSILNSSREVSTVNIAKKALENPLP